MIAFSMFLIYLSRSHSMLRITYGLKSISASRNRVRLQLASFTILWSRIQTFCEISTGTKRLVPYETFTKVHVLSSWFLPLPFRWEPQRSKNASLKSPILSPLQGFFQPTGQSHTAVGSQASNRGTWKLIGLTFVLAEVMHLTFLDARKDKK